MKGVIQSDHIPANKFKLIVVGLPVNFTFTAVSGIEEELDTVDLPDRTVASGGRTAPVELTAVLPLHHTGEQAVMEAWFQESQDPVLPSYKKPATLILTSLTGDTVRSFSFPDMFPAKRSVSDFEMDNDGEMSTVEWTLRASDMFPI